MKKFLAVCLLIVMVLGLSACQSKNKKTSTDFNLTENPIDTIQEVHSWLVSDIWNDGICDFSHYYSSGTNSIGQTMDADFTLKRLTKAMEKKADYDKMMKKLSDEYPEIAEYYALVSEQVDVLYAEIIERGSKVTGTSLDTGLYNQYFDAFTDAYYDAIDY